MNIQHTYETNIVFSARYVTESRYKYVAFSALCHSHDIFITESQFYVSSFTSFTRVSATQP
jgi:hypothetical protein